MISFDRFERSLPVLLDELAAPRLPDYADDLFARTAATRQRAGWTFPERWLPMSAITRRLPGALQIPWRMGALVALLAVAAVAVALVAGALLQAPSMTGPGRNGEIVFVDPDGNVMAGDPVTGLARLVVPDVAAANTKPIFSPDGTKFLILRPSTAGSQNIFVVDLEGNETIVTPSALSAWHYVGWSPRSDKILIRDDGGRILLIDALNPSDPVSLSRNVGMGDLWIGGGFNYRSTTAFRPPNGDEVMFTGNQERTLAAIRQDATGLRTILDVQAAHLGVALRAAQWSPDGRQIAFVLQKDIEGMSTTWIVNADGSGAREVSTIGDQWGPMWSPDGTQIAFEYWTPPPADSPRDTPWTAHPIAIVDVATGALRHVGSVHSDGYLSWDWSPDGMSILAVPRDGFGKIEIVNAVTGDVTTTPWAADQPISWQRLPLE